MKRLGKKHDLDLIECFIGLWEYWDMIWVLEERGQISEHEADDLMETLEAGGDIRDALLPLVRRAYFDFYGSSQKLN
jgi:hypothetical protein